MSGGLRFCFLTFRLPGEWSHLLPRVQLAPVYFSFRRLHRQPPPSWAPDSCLAGHLHLGGHRYLKCLNLSALSPPPPTPHTCFPSCFSTSLNNFTNLSALWVARLSLFLIYILFWLHMQLVTVSYWFYHLKIWTGSLLSSFLHHYSCACYRDVFPRLTAVFALWPASVQFSTQEPEWLFYFRM